MLDMPLGDKVSGCKFPQGGVQTGCGDNNALGSDSATKKLELAKLSAEKQAQEKAKKATLEAEKKAQAEKDKAEKKAKRAAEKLAQEQEKKAQLELKKAAKEAEKAKLEAERKAQAQAEKEEKAKARQLAEMKADLDEQARKTNQAKAKENSQAKNESDEVVLATLKKWAAYLDQQRYIYALYGALDGLNISYSTIKLVTDYLNVGYSSDIIHDWTLVDEGLATAALGSISLIVLAMMANYLQEDSYDLCWLSEKTELEKNKIYVEFAADSNLKYCILDSSGKRQEGWIFLDRLGLKNSKEHPLSLADIRSQMPEILRIVTINGHIKQPNLFKKYLLLVWPYARDVFKGMKNSYKGLRSLINMTDLLGGQNLSFMLVPFALCLGALAVCNRLWYRQMKERRKAADDENKLIRKEILAKKSMTEEEAKRFGARIQRAQGRAERNKGMVSAFYTGFVEGLYLYLGVFALAPLTGPFFVAICALSLTYVLASIPARMYEEYFYQKKLDISVAEVELALSIRVLKTKIERYEQLHARMGGGDVLTNEESEEYVNCFANTQYGGTARIQFIKDRKKLEKLSKLSDVRALLHGLRDGLTAYGVVASFLFAIATILLLASVAFPPALLVAGVVLGMVCLIGFTVHSFLIHRKHREEKPLAQSIKEMDHILNQTSELYKEVKAAEATEKQHQAQPEQSIGELFEEKGLTVDPSPQYFFQEWFEILRSFLSGLGKGSKSTDFTLNHMQKVGTDGHWHSTLTMVLIGIGIQLLYVVGLASRAFARGFANVKVKISSASTTPPASEKSSPNGSATASPPPSSPISSTAPAIPDVTVKTSDTALQKDRTTIVMTEIGEIEVQEPEVDLASVLPASVGNAPQSMSPASLTSDARVVAPSRLGDSRNGFFTPVSSRRSTPITIEDVEPKSVVLEESMLKPQTEEPAAPCVVSLNAANQGSIACATLAGFSL